MSSELSKLTIEELKAAAESLGIEVEGMSTEQIIEAINGVEEETADDSEDRNGFISTEDFVSTYLDVYEAGGTAEDVAKRLFANFPGQVRVRKLNEIASKVGGAKKAGYDLPRLKGMTRRGKDNEKKKALLDRLAALKSKK